MMIKLCGHFKSSIQQLTFVYYGLHLVLFYLITAQLVNVIVLALLIFDDVETGFKFLIGKGALPLRFLKYFSKSISFYRCILLSFIFLAFIDLVFDCSVMQGNIPGIITQ